MSDRDIDYNDLESHEARVDQLELGPIARVEDQHELSQEAPGEDVPQSMIEEDGTRADSWLTFNKGYEQQGFSPADRIGPDNVDSLTHEYTIETESQGFQTNPVIVPSDPPVMYFTQNNAVIRAVNARNGEEFWRYQYSLPEDPEFFVAHRERGVGVYEDKVYWGSPMGSLLAFDRYTGENLWETSVMTPEHEDKIPYEWVGYGITHAPVIYDGKVYVGQTGGDSSAPGFTYAFAIDAETGDIVWRTKNVPEHKWVGDTWKHGNGSNWMSPAIDTESDTVFWNTGNPGPMLNGLFRPGPNQMTAGIVAYDAQDGSVKWNSQMVPHDMWDYDGQETPMVYDVEVDGEERRVVSFNHKNGWSYTHDVETGDLFQRSEPFAKQGGTFLKYPGRGEENASPLWPAITGGTQYPSDTYNPETGKFYLGTMDYVVEIFQGGWQFGADAGVGGGFVIPDNLEELGQSASVKSLDAASGKIDWEFELPDIDPAAPFASLITGGTTATSSGLVFHGSAGGHLYGLHADTGELLWSEEPEGHITTSPVVWDDEDEGKQYVAIAADNTVHVYAGSG